MLDYGGNNASYEEKRKWREICTTESVWELAIHRLAPREYEPFKAWWKAKIKRQQELSRTLVVVDAGKRRNNTWYQMLKRMEEEEFDAGVEDDGRVIFATLDSLVKTIRTGDLPADMWGDDIERGGSALFFHGELFAVDKSLLLDPKIKRLITRIGGVLLDEQILESIEDNEVPRKCYVLTKDLQQKSSANIKSNPLLASDKLDVVCVNSIWVKATLDAGDKCNPKKYPCLFQPQTWPVQQFPSSNASDQMDIGEEEKKEEGEPRLIISISGRYNAQHRAVIYCLEAMGATYQREINERTTHVIVLEPSSTYGRLIESGTAHAVSHKWLYNAMEHGYKEGQELKFPAQIGLEFVHENQKKSYILAKMNAPMSALFECYTKSYGDPACNYEFLFGGKAIIDHTATVESLGLKHRSEIKVAKTHVQG